MVKRIKDDFYFNLNFKLKVCYSGVIIMWITVNEASKLCRCPERTLRHYAVKGQLRTGKKGKKWLLNFDDLIKKGLITDSEAQAYKLKHKVIQDDEANGGPTPASSQVEVINLAPNPQSDFPPHPEEDKPDSSEKPQRYKRVDQIGVFTELFVLFNSHSEKFSNFSQNSLAKPINEQIVTSLKLISMGFFENNPAHKAQHFREAKGILARTVIDLKLMSNQTLLTQDTEQSLPQNVEIQIQESIIPGLIGLINRAEKRFANRNAPETKRASNGK